MEFLVLIQGIVTPIVVVLVGLYIKERVAAEAKEGARLATERALSDYRQEHALALGSQRLEHDRLLAAVSAGNQRSLHEFSLYTQKQHEVYSALYRRVRTAADFFAGLVGFTIGPDFSRFTVDDVRRYLERNQVPAGEGAAVLAAYEQGQRDASRLLDALDYQVRKARAEDKFRRAKNLEALDELYLSDAVRSQLDIVRSAIAALSARLRFPDDRIASARGPNELELRDRMNAAVTDLFRLMREELRRGHPLEAESTSGTLSGNAAP
jgi:hypothetical protein